MRIFHFAPDTGEYLGSGEAQLDPLESKIAGQPVYLLPAHATRAEPPEAGHKQLACWDGEAWRLVPDRRGETYWLPDGTAHEIATLGETPPADALDVEPAKPEPTQGPVPVSVPPDQLPFTRGQALRLIDAVQVGDMKALDELKAQIQGIVP